MKKILLIVALMTSIMVSAQHPYYQAVVRNANGVLLSNSDVNLRVSLWPGQNAGTPTWVEIHRAHTDISGSFGIAIGKGERDENSVVANFSDVDFSAIYYWMKIEILEGETYREVSFQEFPCSIYSLSVVKPAPFPAGIIVPFAGPVENIPSGWMLCDGSEISRSEYGNLYNAIGVNWGVGDNSTTFNLPDLRGMFLRGISGDSGNDPDAENRLSLNDNGGNVGNYVGSYQDFAMEVITGEFKSFDRGFEENTGAFYLNNRWSSGLKSGGGDDWGTHTGFDNSRVAKTSTETRPKNVYVNYIIKY